MLFDWLVTGGILATNPATSVRGPKHVVKTGKTPEALRLYQEALGRSKEKDQVERLRAKIQVLQDGHADGGKDS